MKRARHRFAWLAALLLAPACGCGDAAARAAAWLLQQQRPDGSFRSNAYALLRSGQAMTPFVLLALLQSGAAPPERVDRALAWLRAAVDARGPLGYADPELLEYPLYSTACAVLALAAAGGPEDRARIDRLADWLAVQQCGELRGFGCDHPAYGGFGFGSIGLSPGEPGHVDLAHTRFALQALAGAGRLDAGTSRRAAVFLGRLQHADGGFAFSPVVAAANKAGRAADGGFRPYATATADGLLALQALGLGPEHDRVLRASAWLTRHASAARIGGIDAEPPEPWHDALRFYHTMALAAAWPPARAELRAALGRWQRPDGSFASELVSAMKEDDPLLATALALLALGAR